MLQNTRLPSSHGPRRARGTFLLLAAAAAGLVAASDDRMSGQVFKTPSGQAENVRVERSPGEVISVSYDLVSGDPRAVFIVGLRVSRDGGKTFDLEPRSVSGDVGSGVRAGAGKKIVWQAGKDVETVEMDLFRFSIRLEAANAKPVAAAPEAKPAAAGAGPAAPAAGPKPTTAAKAPAAEAAKKGSPLKWLLPVAGGAGAVGILAASKGKGGGSSSAANTTPTIPTYKDSIAITNLSPAPGSILTATGTPPGAQLTMGSGAMSVTLSVSSAQAIPAYVFVFLLDNNQSLSYCAYNGGYDVPRWLPLPAGQLNVTVTGFRVFRAPCTVTAVRATLNREEGSNSTIIAETRQVLTYEIR